MIDVRNIIESIVLSVQSSGNVNSFTDNLNGTYTIETDSTGNLQESFRVVLQYPDTSLNRDIVIISLTDTSFTFEGIDITEPESWLMSLYFEVGHRIELNKKYLNKEKSANKMVKEFPLFWLYSDFELRPSDIDNVAFETTLLGALVDLSKEDLYEEQRIEQKFEPILYPIMELIDAAFNNIRNKENFVITYGTGKNIDFLIVDRPFFGSADQSKNVLPKITDAIEWQTELKWRENINICSNY